MKRALVIGSPVTHSRSPMIHGYWLKRHGIDGSYEKQTVLPTELTEFLGNLQRDGYAGCNITLPHKEAAALLIPNLDDRARRTGSVNTVYIENGEQHATSTDGQGFVANLKWRVPQLQLNGINVALLGAGGSARAIIDELLRQNVGRITIVNRTEQRAHDLAQHFGVGVAAASFSDLPELLPTTDLLINTTSAGIADAERIPLDFSRLAQSAVVTDINYVPLITPFLREAAAAGHPIVGGLGMLLHQAVFGFSKWFGVTPEVTEDLYDLVARDIDPDYHR